MADYDFQSLAEALLDQAHSLVPEWLPGGSVSGHEYVCGSLCGGPGRSFSVNLSTGKWAEFAAGGTLGGGDLVSLWAAINGAGQGDAFRSLAPLYGIHVPGSNGNGAHPVLPRPAAPVRAVEPNIGPPPKGTPEPQFPGAVAAWCYRDEAGEPLFWVARYQGPNGTKEIRPKSWDKDGKAWVNKGYPTPRPLYGLEQLALRPGDAVMVVEGEKAAESARAIAGNPYIVVTWPNGAAAHAKAAWAPLAGRKVLLWPDADLKTYPEGHLQAGQLRDGDDQPGMAAMLGIASTLQQYCTEVKIIDVGIDLARADGWDAADALAEGWDWARVKAFAGPRLRLLAAPVIAPPPAPNAPALKPERPRKVKPERVSERPRPDALAVARAGAATAAVAVSVSAGDAVEGERKVFQHVWDELGLQVAKTGVTANADNALRVLEQRAEFNGLVWYDEFFDGFYTGHDFNTWLPLDNPVEWMDIHTLQLMTFMQRHLGMSKMHKVVVEEAVAVYGHAHVRNAPRAWLDSLKWDGAPRLDNFFRDIFGAADDIYTRTASKNFWISMVARVCTPGCQVDNMVILEGNQGKNKSQALKLIGGAYSTECRESILTKDFSIQMKGKFLLIINELDAFGKADMNAVKNVVSTSTDRYRGVFGKRAQDHPRRCIFVGTTNKHVYFDDPTGLRRFWPIKIGHVANMQMIVDTRAQCFAEAMHRMREGEPWWAMPATAEVEQEARRVADEWEPIIAEMVDGQAEATVRGLACDAKPFGFGRSFDDLDRKTSDRITNCLRALGWEQHITNRARALDGKVVSARVWRPTKG